MVAKYSILWWKMRLKKVAAYQVVWIRWAEPKSQSERAKFYFSFCHRSPSNPHSLEFELRRQEVEDVELVHKAQCIRGSISDLLKVNAILIDFFQKKSILLKMFFFQIFKIKLFFFHPLNLYCSTSFRFQLIIHTIFEKRMLLTFLQDKVVN